MTRNEDFVLSKERVRLFNSMPHFNVYGWDKTKIADLIEQQDKEFIRRLKFFIKQDRIIGKSNGIDGWTAEPRPFLYEDEVQRWIDTSAGEDLI